MTNKNGSISAVLIVIAFVLGGALVYAVNQREQTPSEKVGEAAEEMADGMQDAVDEMKE